MLTTVTVRHCEIPAELRERAESAVQRLAKTAHRPQRAEVVFNEDHGGKLVELHLYLPRGQVKVASAEAADFRTALDRAVAKMRNQLDKRPGRAARRTSAS